MPAETCCTARAVDRPEWRRAIRDTLPMLLGFVPIALVLGAQAAQKGLSAPELMLMTGFNFAGGSEFVAIDLWSAPPPALLIVAMTLLVNSRHVLMGAALAPFLAHLPLPRALAALFLMCDEAWALGIARSRARRDAGRTPAFAPSYYFVSALMMWSTWVAFTGLGAAIGPWVGDIRPWGFDMAFAAIFLVLMRGMWSGIRAARPWLVSLVAAGATYLLAPGGWYVLVGAVAGVASAWVWGGRE